MTTLLVVITAALTLVSTACKQGGLNEANVKDVAVYGDDFTTKVPADSIFISATIASALIENIKFEKVNQEPGKVTRYHLKLSENNSDPTGKLEIGCRRSSCPEGHTRQADSWRSATET